MTGDGHYRETELVISAETRFETLNSYWILRPTTYLRLPKIEAPRAPHWSAALADGVWLDYVHVWLGHTPAWSSTILRILPAGRGPWAGGVVTSELVTVPDLTFVDGGTDPRDRADETVSGRGDG